METASSRHFIYTGFLKKSPSSISFVIFGRIWKTTRPAPIFVWPTSELPIWPSGRPTSRPEAISWEWGYSANSLSRFGLFAVVMALPGVAGAMPYPSIIISTALFVIEASAYWLVAFTIAAKSAGLREAPPIRPPSISGCARSSAAFFAFMLPP